MPRTEEYQLRPLGWEDDPEEERIRFSSLDYLAASTYNSYAIFFKVKDEDRPRVVEALKGALERTLSQCRQLVGVIEKNTDDDDHSFVKRRDTTVKFIVKHFEPEDNFPSISDIEKAQYASTSIGDVSRVIVPGMAYGEKPECRPDARPVVSAYQANFIPGGLIFVMNFHHYANDAMGWASFVYQLSENSASVVNGTAPPEWDPANLDASRFTATDFPSASKVDGPAPPDRHPLLPEHASLLFHLPKSKAEELKRIATPDDGSWVSTYDAFSALLWRILTKHRVALYHSNPEDTPIWAEGVNMRRRTDPPVARRQQRNLFWAAASPGYPGQLKNREVVSEAPLSRLAAFVRAVTDSVDQAALDRALAALAPVRDKTCLFTRVNAFPPLTIAVTDWRETAICGTDWGFARPEAFRHLFDAVTEGLVLIYPPRRSSSPDEGNEFVLTIENDIVRPVLEDEELRRYFEFRGYEVKAPGTEIVTL